MIPALLVWYVACYVVGTALQSAFGLAEDESLREAGAGGVLVGLLLIALLTVPQLVGIVLGVRARHLGEHRLGTVGVIANATIAAYLVLTGVVQFALL